MTFFSTIETHKDRPFSTGGWGEGGGARIWPDLRGEYEMFSGGGARNRGRGYTILPSKIYQILDHFYFN